MVYGGVSTSKAGRNRSGLEQRHREVRMYNPGTLQELTARRLRGAQKRGFRTRTSLPSPPVLYTNTTSPVSGARSCRHRPAVWPCIETEMRRNTCRRKRFQKQARTHGTIVPGFWKPYTHVLYPLEEDEKHHGIGQESQNYGRCISRSLGCGASLQLCRRDVSRIRLSHRPLEVIGLSLLRGGQPGV